MFGSAVLDAVVGLVFVYLLLSIICTAANETIASMFSLRGRTLFRGVTNLLADKQIGGLEKLLYDHPLVQSLYRGERKPSFIPASIFAHAFLDGIAPGREDGAAAMTEIRRAVIGLPDDSELKRILLVFLRLSGDDFSKFQESIEKWFDDAMARVSGWYKRQSQAIVLILALLLTGVTNADTFQILADLSSNPALRNAVATQAKEYAGKEWNSATQPPQTFGQNSSSSVDGGGGPSNNQPQATAALKGEETLRKTLASLQQTGIRFGWEAMPDRWEWANKIIGLLLTTLAISLGAPFWFDMLDRVIKIRSTGAVPETKTK
ncbi:MAG TPA: hypothetical protein VMG09_15585 [Bacteroidota bacterium]|nr:hypothetical protein [Bacteroidota bacterium]